jgi:GT2 family glycosyltransferase
MLFPRSVLERFGGFDEGFAALGEDADLGLRAAEAGVELVAAPVAAVAHGVLPQTLPTAIASALRRDTMPRLVARHPQQRSRLSRPYFWKESHWRLLAALAGVAASRPGRRWALAAAVPYAAYNFDRNQRSARGILRQAAGLGSRALVDGAEIVATARGALRERTLLL